VAASDAERPTALFSADDGERLYIGAEDSNIITIVELDADNLPLSISRLALEGDVGVMRLVASDVLQMGGSLGIITGDRSLNPIGSWLIPGPDDGKVGVERAKVEGAADFLVVPATHTFIMNRRDVADETVHFLQHGRFRREGG